MQNKENQILSAVILIQFLPDMIIMAVRSILFFRIAGKETGIHGMEDGVVTFGHVTDTIAFGNTELKKETGGISPGIILPEDIDDLLLLPGQSILPKRCTKCFVIEILYNAFLMT